MSHQNCPSYTMSKKKKKKKLNNSKIPQGQDYNIIRISNQALRCPKFQQRANNNQMTISQHQTFNEAWNQQISQKKKTHLEVHLKVWSMGLGVMREPLFIIPFKRWVIFFPMRSEERRPIRGWCHCQCKEKGSLKMGFTKWVCSKNGQ